MTGTFLVPMAARFVRITSRTFALSLLVAFVSVQAFASQYGSPGGALVDDTASAPTHLAQTELASAISRQEATGLTCSERPTLTDTILFQRVGSSSVRVLTFDQAVAASTSREGWIRRYCV